MQILAATGGAPHSDTAVLISTSLALRTHSTITLLTVIRHPKERRQAEAILTRAATLAAQKGVKAKKQIRNGQTTALEIVAEASEGNYDLIVVGERPAHKLLKRLLGPTVERIITHMPCPVLIARPHTQQLNRLLLCEGGRSPSLLDRFVSQIRPLLEAAEELTVLHVMSQMAAAPGISGWELEADANELMAQHTHEGALFEHNISSMAGLPVHLQTKVRHGLVVSEILAEAQDGKHDLIVIGAHHGNMWERFLLDDLAHQIMTKSNTSILII